MWWIDLGWQPGAYQAALSLSLLKWTEQRKYDERLVGQDKDRENIQKLSLWAKQALLRLIKLIHFQYEV